MNHRLRSALVIFAVAALDVVTKMWVRLHVSLYDMIPVIPRVFNIDHTENPGAAFSMFADAQPQLRALFLLGMSVAMMLILGFLLWRTPSASAREGRLMRLGLALVFGGALGNFIDRAFRGTVTDFLQVFIGSYEFPSFNVADSAINVGAWLLIWELLRSRRQTP